MTARELNQIKPTETMGHSLAEWKRIPTRIGKSIRGLTESELDLKGGSDGWTIRENLHHLVEANLVAANMIVAALATDGGYFDWTWVNPNKSWMRRVGYDSAKVEPAIKILRALCEHISTLIANRPQAFSRSVQLSDTTDGPRYLMTVEGILRQEVEHADEHLKMIQAIRERHSR
jgi:hypothetical protein